MNVQDIFRRIYLLGKGTLHHFIVIGQSQAGGYKNGPALTLTTDPDVFTPEAGPIDPAYDLAPPDQIILSKEGDTFWNTAPFGQTGGPTPSPNVETIATSFAQQFKTWRGSSNDKYLVHVQAYGGSTIQQLTDENGGAWFETKALIAHGKSYANAWDLYYRVHILFFHGATGDNVGTTYKAKVKDFAQRFRNYATPFTRGEPAYVFTHQQRPAGTPDYAIQQYSASLEDKHIIVVGPEYPCAYQVDGIHLTNHDTCYLAMTWARAAYRKLFKGGFEPLQLDIAHAVYNGGKQITIPVLNAVGALKKTINAGIELYSRTSGEVFDITVALSGNNVVITIVSDEIGYHDIDIRTGVTANTPVYGYLCDSSSEVDIPKFLDASAQPYNLDKYMVRAEYPLSIFLPVNFTANFGGAAAAPKPVIPGVYSVWDSERSLINKSYTLKGLVILEAVNTASNYFGFTDAGINNKSGTQVLTGLNFFPNDALKNFWFVENKSAGIRIWGLNPTKVYTFIIGSVRTGVGILRQSVITIFGSSQIKTSNRSGTDSVYTTEEECAVFRNLTPLPDGTILITIGTNGTQYGYINVLRVVETS